MDGERIAPEFLDPLNARFLAVNEQIAEHQKQLLFRITQYRCVREAIRNKCSARPRSGLGLLRLAKLTLNWRCIFNTASSKLLAIVANDRRKRSGSLHFVCALVVVAAIYIHS